MNDWHCLCTDGCTGRKCEKCGGTLVTCNFTVDNIFKAVLYNGEPVKNLTGHREGPWEWSYEKSFQFTQKDPFVRPDNLTIDNDNYPHNGSLPSGLLIFEGLRNLQPLHYEHCLWAGLLLHCRATDETSPWHNFVSDKEHWKAEDCSELCTSSFEQGVSPNNAMTGKN